MHLAICCLSLPLWMIAVLPIAAHPAVALSRVSHRLSSDRTRTRVPPTSPFSPLCPLCCRPWRLPRRLRGRLHAGVSAGAACGAAPCAGSLGVGRPRAAAQPPRIRRSPCPLCCTTCRAPRAARRRRPLRRLRRTRRQRARRQDSKPSRPSARASPPWSSAPSVARQGPGCVRHGKAGALCRSACANKKACLSKGLLAALGRTQRPTRVASAVRVGAGGGGERWKRAPVLSGRGHRHKAVPPACQHPRARPGPQVRLPLSLRVPHRECDGAWAPQSGRLATVQKGSAWKASLGLTAVPGACAGEEPQAQAGQDVFGKALGGGTAGAGPHLASGGVAGRPSGTSPPPCTAAAGADASRRVAPHHPACGPGGSAAAQRVDQLPALRHSHH